MASHLHGILDVFLRNILNGAEPVGLETALLLVLLHAPCEEHFGIELVGHREYVGEIAEELLAGSCRRGQCAVAGRTRIGKRGRVLAHLRHPQVVVRLHGVCGGERRDVGARHRSVLEIIHRRHDIVADLPEYDVRRIARGEQPLLPVRLETRRQHRSVTPDTADPVVAERAHEVGGSQDLVLLPLVRKADSRHVLENQVGMVDRRVETRPVRLRMRRSDVVGIYEVTRRLRLVSLTPDLRAVLAPVHIVRGEGRAESTHHAVHVGQRIGLAAPSVAARYLPLLRDVQIAVTGDSGQREGDQAQYSEYLFHNRIFNLVAVIFRKSP